MYRYSTIRRRRPTSIQTVWKPKILVPTWLWVRKVPENFFRKFPDICCLLCQSINQSINQSTRYL